MFAFLFLPPWAPVDAFLAIKVDVEHENITFSSCHAQHRSRIAPEQVADLLRLFYCVEKPVFRCRPFVRQYGEHAPAETVRVVESRVEHAGHDRAHLLRGPAAAGRHDGAPAANHSRIVSRNHTRRRPKRSG
jgi:hypothetical protein